MKAGATATADSEHSRMFAAGKWREPGLQLQIGIALITLGMVLIAIGVIAGAFFIPGLYVLMAGFLATVLAGVLYAFTARPQDA